MGIARNLYCHNHKTTNEKFRDGWEKTFGKRQEGTRDEKETISEASDLAGDQTE